ncbi:MAG: hypothetical protein R2881_04785 [Eubacteriales bacterium]
MALKQYRIPVFTESIRARRKPPQRRRARTPATWATIGGRLAVANGYIREHDTAFFSPESVKRLYVWTRAGGRHIIAVTADSSMRSMKPLPHGRPVYTFGAEATTAQYDFQTAKINGYGISAHCGGGAQMAKWDGESASAEAFSDAEGFPISPSTSWNSILRVCSPPETRQTPTGCITARLRNVRGRSRIGRARRRERKRRRVRGDRHRFDPITGLFALSNLTVDLQARLALSPARRPAELTTGFSRSVARHGRPVHLPARA